MKDETEALSSKLACSVAAYLTEAADPPFAELTGIEIREHVDVLHIRLEPELPQHRKVPIQNHEPVAVLFDKTDVTAPRFFSARADFPVDLDLVHTNRDFEADGIGLCLWEQAWGDLSRTLTAQGLVERMRRWFTLTARGEVHPQDQRLEPLLPGTSNTLIMPAGIPHGPWHVVRCTEIDQRYTLLLDPAPVAERPALSFALFTLELGPVIHGALKRRPYDFAGLATLISELGADLMDSLRAWLLLPEQLAGAADLRALMLIVIPLRRSADDPAESYEIWAYSSLGAIAEFGESLGITMTADAAGKSLTAPAVGGQPGDLAQLLLMPWRVVQQLDRNLARHYAANERSSDAALVAIGAGAIGSNIVINSAKAGIGCWTIIDDDVVLPHNTVRQTQAAHAVGAPKALALTHDANILLADHDAARAIVADVLKPGDRLAEITSALAVADLVVDFSASLAVVGHIADAQDLRRAASFFFNPDGCDLVILAEDAERRLRIDEIEAQYFLACALDPHLADHLAAARIDRLRYANACQDLTRPLPPWQVQTLAGLAAGRLLGLLDEKAASAQMWQLDPPTGLVVPITLVLAATHRVAGESIRISISEEAISTMRLLRAEREPNETGGVLVGSFDLVRNCLHVVGALPAPPDSRQSPTFFIRGARDLRPKIDAILQNSAGQIHYIGEWHSHPDGAAARPSSDDERVFEHLARQLGPGGSPFAMLICGAADSWIRAGWQDRGTAEGVISYDSGQ